MIYQTLSKGLIDKSGKILSESNSSSSEELIEFEEIFDYYRMQHLKPLTELTLKLQEWLQQCNFNYYIAQRIKRKPQILRKLKRFSTRYSQLQDIGGCRIVIENNSIADKAIEIIKEKILKSKKFCILKTIDYREFGREDSGYRAVHIIVSCSDLKLELQIRSQIQHYWAESIEKISVIYGYRLKELEGDINVRNFFKITSNIFYEKECGREPSEELLIHQDDFRQKSEVILRKSENAAVLDSVVNESYINAMIQKESRLKSKFNNWILIFSWNTGNFVNWELAPRQSEAISESYIRNEKQYTADNGYEVVIIGSTDVSTIAHTHSLYFGVEKNFTDLNKLPINNLLSFSSTILNDDEIKILQKLFKKGYWQNKRIKIDTIKNHFCSDIKNIEKSIKSLNLKGYIIFSLNKDAVSLNLKKKPDIEKIYKGIA